MRIKKQFMNEESLRPYGFTNNTPYYLSDEHSEVFIYWHSGELLLAAPQCEMVEVAAVIYRLILDGLVEL